MSADGLREHQFWGHLGLPLGDVSVAIAAIEPATAHDDGRDLVGWVRIRVVPCNFTQKGDVLDIALMNIARVLAAAIVAAVVLPSIASAVQ